MLALAIARLAGSPASAQSSGVGDANTSGVSDMEIAGVDSFAKVYPPQGDALKAARKLLLDGHYPEYVQQLKIAGANGDMQCMNELAALYNEGRIVEPDQKKAFAIWQELTAKQYGPALYNLGLLYAKGETCAKDHDKSLSLFSQATQSGCDYGIFGAACLSQYGYGGKTDSTRAMALYEELAAKDSPLGWYGKANLLCSGTAVKADPKQAISLFERAAQAGLPEAQRCLSDIYYYGEKVPSNYKLARHWAEQGSAQGDAECQLRLSDFKLNGIGGPKDCQGGISLLKALAEQSVLEAQNRLGHYYRIGNCVEKNLVSAKYWLEKAAARNYLRAINELACLYFYGEGVPKDLKMAFELNLKVAGLKNADPSERASSEYGVGLAYDKGWGVKKDLKQARIWYARAAAAGNPHACNNLSNIYMEGRGCPANPALAMSLRRLGVKNGCWMACQNLAADYQYGLNGVSKNISEAIRLYKKSLELRTENPIATLELAKIYEQGLAGKGNRKLARQYYMEAAKYGSEEARKKLGQQRNQTTRKCQK